MYNVLIHVVVVSGVVRISLIRLLPIRVQRTWVYLTVSHKKFSLFFFLYYYEIAIHTHKDNKANLKFHSNNDPAVLVAILQSSLSLLN